MNSISTYFNKFNLKKLTAQISEIGHSILKFLSITMMDAEKVQ